MGRPVLPAGLTAQYGPSKSGRVLILDGDGPCYVAAATAKTLPTAIRRFQQAVLAAQFMCGAESVSVHTTAQSCYKAGRSLVRAVQPYQGNRKGKAKPPLLETLREAMAQRVNWLPEFNVTHNYIVEADDAMMHEAHVRGDNGIIRSEDKDLRMTPYPYYDLLSGTVQPGVGFGHIAVGYTPAGAPKPLGQGRKFFWFQMLFGDQADHVKGLLRLDGALCGIKTGWEYLDPYTDEHAAANAVIDAYRAIDQNPIPEGWLLWILRSPDDTVWKYWQSIRWSPENAAFLIDCYKRHWHDFPSADS